MFVFFNDGQLLVNSVQWSARSCRSVTKRWTCTVDQCATSTEPIRGETKWEMGFWGFGSRETKEKRGEGRVEIIPNDLLYHPFLSRTFPPSRMILNPVTKGLEELCLTGPMLSYKLQDYCNCFLRKCPEYDWRQTFIGSSELYKLFWWLDFTFRLRICFWTKLLTFNIPISLQHSVRTVSILGLLFLTFLVLTHVHP